MNTWIIAFECYKINLSLYPVEIALLNVEDEFCYTYHIDYSDSFMERHNLITRRHMEDHGLGCHDGCYTYEWVRDNLREILHWPGDILYVIGHQHMYLAKMMLPHLHNILECQPLPLGDNTQQDATCAVHKRLGDNLSCARRKCFQAAVVIGIHKK